MTQRIAEFATFVDAARCLRRNVTGNSAREAELLEQPRHSLFVLADVRIHLAIGALEIGVGDERWTAMPRADDVDHVQVIFFDDSIEMHAQHVEARRRAPVSEQPWLDVLTLKRLSQQRIVEQINLSDGKVVGSPPVRVQLVQLHSGKRTVCRWMDRFSRLSRLLRCYSGHRAFLFVRSQKAGPIEWACTFRDRVTVIVSNSIRCENYETRTITIMLARSTWVVSHINSSRSQQPGASGLSVSNWAIEDDSTFRYLAKISPTVSVPIVSVPVFGP